VAEWGNDQLADENRGTDHSGQFYRALRLSAICRRGWTPSNSARLYIRKVDVFSSTGVSKKANASAVTDLTSRVDSAEGKLVSQSQAIAKLQNDLTTTNATVSKKADQSALTSLTGRVEKTESGLTAANGNITS
jgi:uncharacterized coiled-coil protein SlyX